MAGQWPIPDSRITIAEVLKKAGTTSNLISATIDMIPTFCALLNLPVPAKVDGISTLPTLLGKEQLQKKHPYPYFEYPEYAGQQAVRMGNWKAVRLGILKGVLKTQLFDLNSDIQEQNDIAAQHPGLVKRMEAIMEKEHHRPEVSRFIMHAPERKATH